MQRLIILGALRAVLATAAMLALLTAAHAQRFESKEPTQEELRKELYPVLLGSWGLISDQNGRVPQTDPFSRGVKVCSQQVNVPTARFTDEATQKLPPATMLRGNITYYAVGDSLQRLDTAMRQVGKFDTIEKRTDERGRSFWILSFPQGAVRLVFGEANNGGQRAPVLVEERAVYIKCPFFEAPTGLVLPEDKAE